MYFSFVVAQITAYNWTEEEEEMSNHQQFWVPVAAVAIQSPGLSFWWDQDQFLLINRANGYYSENFNSPFLLILIAISKSIID